MSTKNYDSWEKPVTVRAPSTKEEPLYSFGSDAGGDGDRPSPRKKILGPRPTPLRLTGKPPTVPSPHRPPPPSDAVEERETVTDSEFDNYTSSFTGDFLDVVDVELDTIIPESSFLHLLREICEAFNRKESAIDYDSLLPKIFDEREPYDSVLQSEVEVKDLSILEVEEIFGRKHEKQKLLSELMVRENNKGIQLSAIPILGACGIGKTALAKLVYEDEVVKENFELRVWVKVDGQEFNLHRAAQEIIKSTTGMSCSVDDLDVLDEMVKDTLHSYKCLIVFDEVVSMQNDSWIHIKQFWFNVVGLGSKILITTTSKDVAHLVANQSFELSQLSTYAGWVMCTYLALDSGDSIEDMPISMAKRLAALCRGNPLLLKLVGSLMKYDYMISNAISSLDFMENILMSSFDESVVVLMCVWAIPPHLRQCLAYCALFRKGCALNKERIIDMWMAHGLVKPSLGNNYLHGIGESYFHQLLSRSFLTDITYSQYGNITEFRLPGLIHKIMHNLAIIFWKGKVGVIGSISEDAGQLSIVSLLEEKINPDLLQMLILSPSTYSGGSLDHSLLQLKDLQSLDLSCSGIRNFPDDICALTELRYLNLSYTLIESLPSSIMNLSQLQTLDLSCSYHFKVLPKGICSLTKMSHLDLSLCDSLSYLPSGIRSLTSLSSMPLFVLGKDHDNACLGDLRLLNQLRGRLEIRNLENAKEISEARDAMLHKKNLQHLKLSWNQSSDDCLKLLELLQPNPHLKVLEITGYSGVRFPWWISSINSLTKISITDCGCKELPPLGQLPFLKELQLKGMVNIETIDDEFYGDGLTDVFPSLGRLGLYDMPKLLVWLGAGRASRSVFRRLRTLTVKECPHLRILPTLPTLPDLIVSDSNYRILSSLTSFSSLSSLLIKDMELRMSCFGLNRLTSLKKLILFNIRDIDSSYIYMRELPALRHLGILHCHQLRDIILHDFIPLQKLHIVDCCNLARILFVPEVTTLIELVVEDCPKLYLSSISIGCLYPPRKLILRSSDHFIMDAEDLKEFELEYLSISGCPQLEKQLGMEPSLISHIPCVILGNHEDGKDFEYALLSASSESKRDPQKKSMFKDTGRKLSKVDENKDLYLISSWNSDDDSSPTTAEIFRPFILEWQKGELLGRGSFGNVYEGITVDGFFFAVKEVSLLDQGDNEKQHIVQLRQEIELLSQFAHKNIVQYYGSQMDESHLYIFLELVTRGSILSLYQKYVLTDSVVCSYTRQILHGLKYLHDRNVVHRRIKCANILIDANGLVKLADFGLTKAMHWLTINLNDVKGTPFWMAPEVVRWQRRMLGLGADIWSLGCTVLEMLTRRFPYSNLEYMQALFRIGRGDRPDIPDSVSSNARDFILDCLQFDPSLRPTAAQLLDHPFVNRFSENYS
ncbi:MAPK/ERK kinase kinase 1 [Perilla frutescens var. frutescens]|nr:MAPK/ERK kinase kinase 1 [Perilla frutescens var. frutescens]